MITDPEYLLRGRKIKKMVELSSEGFRQKYKLKQIEIEVLIYLSTHPGTTASAIVNELDLHKGQLSDALQHLVNLNYAVEYHDPKDHRYVHYETTEKSVPLANALLARREELKQQLFKGFTDEEINELHRLIKKMTTNINEVIRS